MKREHSVILWKCIIGSTALLALLIASVSQSSTTGDNAKKEVKEAAAAIGDYTSEQKDAAVDKAKELMDKLDTRMELWETKLEGKWQDLKQTSKENYTQSKQELKERRSKVSQWYENMKDSSADAWDNVKQGFSNSYNELSESFDETEKKLDSEQ